MSSVSTFMHLLIGLAGAAIAGYGGTQVGDDKINAALYKKCIAAPLVKGQTPAKRKAACDAKYPQGGALLHQIMMYGGCGLILVLFIVLWFLGGGMSGMGGGMSGGFYQQQF